MHLQMRMRPEYGFELDDVWVPLDFLEDLQDQQPFASDFRQVLLAPSPDVERVCEARGLLVRETRGGVCQGERLAEFMAAVDYLTPALTRAEELEVAEAEAEEVVRFYELTRQTSREVPAQEMRQRQLDLQEMLPELRATAVEVGLGVWITIMGWGDLYQPADGSANAGCRIAVWTSPVVTPTVA